MNRLKDSASAYLKQHAQDPVHWQPWGAEAFDQAEREDKPVFISIGYAACHWCHVMARESFRDFEVAKTLNENFVSIKVDREEHPQVDERYMSATQLMTGQGGWPMTIFALPDGQVFFAGTYFPPEPRNNQPSFSQLLTSVHHAWVNKKDQLVASTAKISAALKEENALNRRILTAELPGPNVTELFGENLGWIQLGHIIAKLSAGEEQRFGGFGPERGPKFPPHPALAFLNAYLAADFGIEEGGDQEQAQAFATAREQATGLRDRLLDAMGTGAFYDHLNGGFFRYTVDGGWQLPHFEKMLFDNAYLLQAYASAALHTGNQFWAKIARHTAHWIVNELQLAHGGFASSLEADSEVAGFHVEGGYYIYSDKDLAQALGQLGLDTELLGLRNGVHVPEAADYAEELAGAKTVSLKRVPSEEEFTGWEAAMAKLAADREEDPTYLKPSRDEKVVAAWNGQSILALLEAHTLWPEEGFAQAALAAAEYLWNTHVGQDRLMRTSFSGEAAEVEGTLSDYVQTQRAFAALYRCTGQYHWFERAEAVDAMTHSRLITGGVIREVAKDDVQVKLLSKLVDEDYWASPVDDTEPSAVSRYVLAQWELALLRGVTTDDNEHVTRLISFGLTSGTEVPTHLGGVLEASVQTLQPGKTLLLRGLEQAEQVAAQRWAAQHGYLPIVIAEERSVGAPVAEQAAAMEQTGPLLLRCAGTVCLPPVATVSELS